MNDRKLNTATRLLPNQLVQAEMARNVWRIHLESEMKPDDFLKAESFAHVSKMLRRGDILEALAEDSSWFATFLVRSVEGLHVRTAMLTCERFDSSGALVYEDYLVEWHPKARGRVIRKIDQQVMIEGLASKDAAEEWLRERSTAPEQQQDAA